MTPETRETKRRLLLAKWGALAPHLDHGAGAYECLNKSLDPERQGLLDEVVAEWSGRVDDLEEALTVVRYWMHDVMDLNRPAGDPRRILRTIEDAL